MSKSRNGADRSAWMTPYNGGVSQFDEDRNRGASLPSGLSTSGYGRIAQVLDSKRQKREAMSRQWRGLPQEQSAAPPDAQTRSAAMQRQARQATPAKGSVVRIASLEAATKAGFKRVASCMYKRGHDIWELRGADGGGYELVRKREERAVDLRQAQGGGMAPAVEAGIIRTAGLRRSASSLRVVRAALTLLVRVGQLSPEQAAGYEQEWQQGRPLSAVLDEVNFLLQTRGQVPELVQVKSALEKLIADEGQQQVARAAQLEGMGEEEPDLSDDMGDDMGGEPEMPVDEGEYLGDTVEQAYDIHEVMHGREPEFDPGAPMVEEMQDVVDQADMGESYDLGPEMGEPDLSGEPMQEGMEHDYEGAGGVPGGPAMSSGVPGAVAQAKCGKCGQAKCGCAGVRGARKVKATKGLKILAVRKGAVAEGMVLELLPLGDLLADFGEGPEELAGDMVLEPELDLEELELEECEDCGCAPCECALESGDEVAEDEEAEESDDAEGEVGGGSEPQVLVITVDDVLGM